MPWRAEGPEESAQPAPDQEQTPTEESQAPALPARPEGPAGAERASEEPAEDVSARPSADSLPLRVIASGTQSAVRIPVARMVTTQLVWEEVWSAIHANVMNPPPVPDVDFSSESVIVLVLGERRSGGYGVRVRQVTEERNSVIVEVEVTSPDPDAMVTLQLTSPYLLAAIPKIRKPVVFAGDDVRDGYSPYD